MSSFPLRSAQCPVSRCLEPSKWGGATRRLFTSNVHCVVLPVDVCSYPGFQARAPGRRQERNNGRWPGSPSVEYASASGLGTRVQVYSVLCSLARANAAGTYCTLFPLLALYCTYLLSVLSAMPSCLHTARCSTEATLAGWSQLLIVIFHLATPQAWHQTRLGWHISGSRRRHRPVDPALPIEAFYLGNLKLPG